MRIHDYARRGDHDSLRGELQKGVPVDERDDRDYTPLACAARSSQADDAVMKLLIGWGADVNAAVDEAKHTPLSLAACSGDLSKVNCLLEAGATVNRVSPKGYTP